MLEKLLGSTHAHALAPRNHKDRRASIEARARKIENEWRTEAEALRKKVSEHEARYRAGLVGLEQAALDRAVGLVAELVTDTRKALTDAVREWMREPSRVLATRIAATTRTMLEREENEVPVGNAVPRVPRILAYVMCDALLVQYPRAMFDALGTNPPHGYGEAISTLLRAVDAPNAFGDALEQLEDLLTQLAQRELNVDEQGREMAAKRWRIVRQCDPRALEEFDGLKRRADHAAWAATYQPPSALPARNLPARPINTGIQPGDPLARHVAPVG
jgi:hypothetical protein